MRVRRGLFASQVLAFVVAKFVSDPLVHEALQLGASGDLLSTETHARGIFASRKGILGEVPADACLDSYESTCALILTTALGFIVAVGFVHQKFVVRKLAEFDCFDGGYGEGLR